MEELQRSVQVSDLAETADHQSPDSDPTSGLAECEVGDPRIAGAFEIALGHFGSTVPGMEPGQKWNAS